MSLQAAANPFVGLRPFESEESLLFFGRQEQTTELLQRLHEHHFVSVVGSSGSGKSSLIRAGLIPNLKAGYLVSDRDKWLIAIMKPGESPLYNLAAALLKELPDTVITIESFIEKIREEGADAIINLLSKQWTEHQTNIFLLADQFEELFRFSMDSLDTEKKDEAIDFVNILLELSAQKELPVYIVITMRSDFIGDCSRFYGLPEALNRSQYLVPRLTRIQLKTAIEGPVKLYGGKISPALTAKLLNDVQTLQDELPLLQHLLMRIWDEEASRNKNGALGLEDYTAAGGIEKALSKHADEALTGMNEQSVQASKKIFQALTTTDQNGRKVRRPAHLSKLCELSSISKEEVLGIIQHFNDDKRAFLVVNTAGNAADPLIDISHESLIRQWNTLGIWVEEEEESGKIYKRLAEAARLNRQQEKDLLTGSELQLIEEWRIKFNPGMAWAKQYDTEVAESLAYLEKSKEAWQASLLMKKRQRKKKFIVIFSVVFAFIALLTAYTFSERKLRAKADKQKNAFRLIQIAHSVEDEDPTKALRLAEEALKIGGKDSIIMDAIEEIYSRQHAYYRTIEKDSANKILFCAVGGSGNKDKMLTATNKHVKIWTTEGQLVRVFTLPQIMDSLSLKVSYYLDCIALSPDSRFFFLGISFDDGNDVKLLFDNEKGGVRRLAINTKHITAARMSPDSKGIFLATGNEIGLYSLDGKLVKVFKYDKATKGHITAIAVSADNTKLLSGDMFGDVYTWQMNGKLLKTQNCHDRGITDIDIAPDNSAFITASLDETAALWKEGEAKPAVLMHKDAVTSARFSSDGENIITSSNDNLARLWNADGSLVKEFKGHSNGVNMAAFLPNGRNVLTVSNDRTARIWNVYTSQLWKSTVVSPASLIKSADILASGRIAVHEYFSPTMQFLDMTTGAETGRTSFGGNGFLSAEWSSDGNFFIGCTKVGITVWKANGAVYKNIPHEDAYSVSFAPDGKKILSASYESVKIWNLNGNVLDSFRAPGGNKSLAFAPDGNIIETISDNDTISLWNTKGKLLTQISVLPAGQQRNNIFNTCVAKMSPDKKYILIGTHDDTARLFSVATGKILTKYKGHVGAISSLAFSADGTKILTGSSDNRAILWDLRSGKLLWEFKRHTGPVVSVCFSTDGKYVLTGSNDKTVRLWQYLNPEQIHQQFQMDKLNLTREEKQELRLE
jgi:WD40 repeat protein/energy-coupling factor transporter ATP-binding protein EcfA2